MKTESKTNLLLRMMEQPEQYTEEQWRDVLSNDECRELYTMMALTQGAMDAAQADAALTDEAIAEEWEKTYLQQTHPRHTHLRWPFRIAAIFLVAAFLGGLAWALSPILKTFPYGWFNPKGEEPRYSEVTTPLSPGGGWEGDFSDVRLDSILSVVSAHYGKAVCFLDTAAQGLRLSTMWNSEDSLSVFIATLNEFDGLVLKDERDTIFVESETEEGE